MNQIFKSFINTDIKAVEQNIIEFVNSEKVNPLSIGVTERPNGHFLAILGYDTTFYTPVIFLDAQSSGVEEDLELFDTDLNDTSFEEDGSEHVICHAITYDLNDVLHIIRMVRE